MRQQVNQLEENLSDTNGRVAYHANPTSTQTSRAASGSGRKKWARRGLEAVLLCAALLAPLLASAAEIDTAYVGIELRLSGSEIYGQLQKNWPNSKAGAAASVASVATNSGISLSNELHQRVQSGQLSPGEALQMESELMMRHDSIYYLPTSQEELKDTVGFPKDTALTPNDLRDLIPVHVQMSLGISPMTAAYLVEKLNVTIVVTPQEAEANGLASDDPTSSPAASAGAPKDPSPVVATPGAPLSSKTAPSNRPASPDSNSTEKPATPPSAPAVVRQAGPMLSELSGSAGDAGARRLQASLVPVEI